MSIAGALGMALGIDSPEVDDYQTRMQACLGRLDAWSDPVLPTNEGEYLALSAIRSAITSLSCYTANTDHPENDRVWKLESVYGALQARYNRRAELKHGPDRTLARYLLWNYRFTHVPRHVALLEARDRGLLRKNEHGHVFVIGITAKVGDNTFTVDHRGRHYRQYCKTVGRQAIGVLVPFEGELRERFLATIAPLDPHYHETFVEDRKNSVRPIALRRSERRVVQALLEASRHLEAPVYDVPAPPAEPVTAPPAAPAPAASQAELFAAAA